MTRLEFWNRYLGVYDTANIIGAFGSYMDDVAERLRIHPGHVVLDAGSGTGNLSIRMRRLGARVTSLDFSPVALAVHRAKDPTATLVHASLESELPFESDTFDAVACTSVLFALSTPGARTALREFRRVLKPGGHVVVTVEVERRLPKLRFTCVTLLARLRAQGVPGFLRELRRISCPLLRLMYYNFLMHSLRKKAGYRRFTKEDLLAEVALTPVSSRRTMERPTVAACSLSKRPHRLQPSKFKARGGKQRCTGPRR